MKGISATATKHALEHIRAFFLGSSDFNGIVVTEVREKLGLSQQKLERLLTNLLRSHQISLAFERHAVNPHIKRLPDLSVEEQVARLTSDDPQGICVYPPADVVRSAVDVAEYNDRPFTQRLLLAEAQLTPVFFELQVLERYYRDPRYHFDFCDLSGSISISTQHYETTQTAQRDKVLLQMFGIGYDEKRNRVVVVYLRYLSDLSPEHQRFWHTNIVSTPCTINSDYARAGIWDLWPEYHSAYRAFLAEQAEINKLSQIIGKPPLFRRIFLEDRPRDFTPMLRPTRRNLYEFAHLLEKMLSENINRDFFRGDIRLENEVHRKNGKVEVQTLGTRRLLEDWLSTYYRSANGDDIARSVVAPFRKVRKLRDELAHEIKGDHYDLCYPRTQDELLGRACRALTELRLILSSHPYARNRYRAPDWLDGDKIVFY